MTLSRSIVPAIRADLPRKMVFLGGPRQVGKTTLALGLRPKRECTYLNWDIDDDRTQIIDKELGATPLLVLDELHKHRRWRQYLKGLYDGMKVGRTPRREVLVTGSARLDLYRYGGDSLQGRYHYYRLLPLSPQEVGATDALPALYRYGGFPEQFLAQSETDTRRFAREYRARMIRDDLRDLEQVSDLTALELLAGRLPDLVGSPLSINALREDLQVAHKTMSRWLDILERLYGMVRIAPLAGPKIRAVKQERKAYVFDWTTVREPGPRFENLVAIQLLKHCYQREDCEGIDIELRFFRDKDGREVDFVIVEDRKPTVLVECKLTPEAPSKALTYLHGRYPTAKAFQVHLDGEPDRVTASGIRVCSAGRLLELLARS